MHNRVSPRRCPLGLLAVLAIAAGGCGRRVGPDVQFVEGVVLAGDRPVDGAFVDFHPAAGGMAAAGMTDSAGRFLLTSDRGGRRNAGAVAGAYKVAIFKLRDDNPPLPPDPTPDDWARRKPASNVLPDKYRDPETSGLEATVKPGRNSFRFALD